MHSAAEGSYGMSMEDKVNAAVSRMAPADVIHEFSAFGERKKTSAGNVVWLSSTSANQVSQVFQ